MKTFVTILITAAVVSLAFLWTLRYHPSWLMKFEFDEQGFPRIKKKNDMFILKGSTYIYNGTIWVKLDANGLPIEPTPAEGDKYTKDGVDYIFTKGRWVAQVGPLKNCGGPGQISCHTGYGY